MVRLIHKWHVLALSSFLFTLWFGGLAWAQPQPTGTLELISATVDAKVIVDGEYVGDLPLQEPIEMPAGEHTIKITKRGYTDYVEILQIMEGPNEPLFVDLFPVAGVLVIDTGQSGAVVSVDGEVLGQTPFEGEIQPGKRSIMVSRKGYKDYVQVLDIEAGQEYLLDIKLEQMEELPLAAEEVEWYETWWFWTATGTVIVAAATITIVALAGGEEGGVDVDHTISIPDL